MPVSIGPMNLIYYFHHFAYCKLFAIQVVLFSLKDIKHASTFLWHTKYIQAEDTPYCYLVSGVYHLHLQCHQAGPKASILAIHLHMGTVFSRLCLTFSLLLGRLDLVIKICSKVTKWNIKRKVRKHQPHSHVEMQVSCWTISFSRRN